MNTELIADKIEEVIKQMIVAFREFDPRSSEYAMFYDPKKHPSWFILIYFADRNQLKEGIKNGTVFQINSYLSKELDKVEEISTIDRAIFFEWGNRPTERIGINNAFDLLLDKMKALKKNAGKSKSDTKICVSCGHDFDKHQMLFNNENGKVDLTTEGWIMCPEENCTCFHTWGVNSNGGDNLKNENKESWLKRVFKKLFN